MKTFKLSPDLRIQLEEVLNNIAAANYAIDNNTNNLENINVAELLDNIQKINNYAMDKLIKIIDSK